MTSIGTGYDLSNSIFSPDGRNFQVEYAAKAVENSGTSVGIKCKDGIVFATEKLMSSKLLVADANKRIQTIDRHVGIVSSGLTPDARHIVNRGRQEAQNFKNLFKQPISVPQIVSRLGNYVQVYTTANSVRPFGIATILGGKDPQGYHLYMIEPSGVYWGYHGIAVGKGRQAAKSELEKLDLANMNVKDAVKEAARIIYIAHEDFKDKEFELEVSWISDEHTKGRHEFIPIPMLIEARRYAEDEDEDDDEEEEDEEDTEMQD